MNQYWVSGMPDPAGCLSLSSCPHFARLHGHWRASPPRAGLSRSLSSSWDLNQSTAHCRFSVPVSWISGWAHGGFLSTEGSTREAVCAHCPQPQPHGAWHTCEFWPGGLDAHPVCFSWMMLCPFAYFSFSFLFCTLCGLRVNWNNTHKMLLKPWSVVGDRALCVCVCVCSIINH